MVTIKDIALKGLNRIDSSGELAYLYEMQKLGKHKDYQLNMPLWLKTYQFESLLKEERKKCLGNWGGSVDYRSEPVHHFLTQMFESKDLELEFFCELLIESYVELYPSIPDVLKTDDLNWCFLERDFDNILEIKNPTEEMWAYALRRNGELIAHLEEPTVGLQKIAVRSNRKAIRCIKNPCDEAKKIALLESGRGWRIDLDDVKDPRLNELAIVLSERRIRSIQTPSAKLETIALIVEDSWEPFFSGNEDILNLFPFLREYILDHEDLNGRYENEKMLTLLAREKESPSDTIPRLYFLKDRISEEVLSYFADEKRVASFVKTTKELPFSIQCHFYQCTFSVGEWENPYNVDVYSTKLTSFMKEIELKATDRATIERIFEPFLREEHLTKELQTQLIDYLNDHPYDFIRLPNRLKTPLICRLITSKVEDLKLFSPYHLEEWLTKNKIKEVDLELRIIEEDGLPF